MHKVSISDGHQLRHVAVMVIVIFHCLDFTLDLNAETRTEWRVNKRGHSAREEV